MDPRTEAWKELLDRATSPQRLQEIALNYPDFRQAVLEHPNVYPELADWIAQQPAAVTPQPEFPAHAGSEFAPGKGSLPDDDLRPSVPLETPTSGSRLPKILLVSAVSVLALALVGGLIFWLTIGRKIQGAATPEGAVEKLIAATVEADPLSLYGSLAPSEVSPLREVLESAQNLEGVDGSQELFVTLEELWDALEITVTDLEFELVELDEGITRVDIVEAEIRVSGDEREITRIATTLLEQSLETAGMHQPMIDETVENLEYRLEEFFDYDWPVRAELEDLFDAAESSSDDYSWFTGIPIVTVQEGGRWYVSPLLTYGELLRVTHEMDYYSEERYRYGSVPDPLSAATPEEAFINLTEGIDQLVERGRPAEFVASLPLAERRFYGLHSEFFDSQVYFGLALPTLPLAPFLLGDSGDYSLDISGTVEVVNQRGDWALLHPAGLRIETMDAYSSYPSILELDGLCGTYQSYYEPSDRFCLDRDLSDVLGFELDLDLTNLGIVAVKENGNWHLSPTHSYTQVLKVLLENIDQEFLDTLQTGIEEQHLAARDSAAASDLRNLAMTVETAAVECWGDYSRVEIMDRGFVVDVYCDGWESGSSYLSSDTSLIDWEFSYSSFSLTAASGSGKSITYDSALGGILPY